MTVIYTHEDIVGMAEALLRSYGLELDRFITLGKNDQLDEPELRDFWLIWGPSLLPGPSYLNVDFQ